MSDKEITKLNNNENKGTNSNRYVKLDGSNEIEREKDKVINVNESDNDNESSTINLKFNKIIKVKKLGNVHAVYFFNNENPLFIIGPEWFCYFIFSSVDNLIMFVMFYCFNSCLDLWVKIYGITISILFNCSYLYTFLINPGYPKKLGNITNYGKYRFCKICNIYVKNDINLQTVHCFRCNICIEGYDHHCPWIGKCVGKNNDFSFKVFVISSFLTFSVFLLTAVIVSKN